MQHRTLLLAAALATARCSVRARAVLGPQLELERDRLRARREARGDEPRSQRSRDARARQGRPGRQLADASPCDGPATVAEGGYYDLYLTKGGKPVVLCGSFNVRSGEAIVRFSAAYDLSHFDRDGWGDHASAAG